MEYYTAKKKERRPSSHIDVNKSHDHSEEGNDKTHRETERHSLRDMSRLNKETIITKVRIVVLLGRRGCAGVLGQEKGFWV